MPLFRRPSRNPLWHDEFSVFTADERYVSRRQMTKFFVLTSFAMFAGHIWIVVRNWFHKESAYPVQPVVRAGDIPVGGVKLFRYPGPKDACIMVRTAENSYVAYSQKCTHLSCAVYYSKERNRLECPCHEGYFSVEDGSVIQGPPERPLPRVQLERRGDQLVAIAMSTGREGSRG